MINTYILFAISALLVIYTGTKLSKYGDIIAGHTPLGHSIVGGVLIAAATSLPEFVTSISSALIDAPDIAIGNVYGSNIFNLMILAVVDIFYKQGRFLVNVKLNHMLAGMFGILLSALGIFGVLLAQISGLDIAIGGVGLISIFIFATYAFASILIVRYENKVQVQEELAKEESEEIKEANGNLRRAIVGFGLSSAIIIWAGINLTYAGDTIAAHTGLGHTFVGTLLIAATTSLPELVASITAIKIGAYDMAVGSVLGSNIFNMLIITVTDVVYYQQSIYGVIDISHVITAMAGIILSSIAVIGLFYRSKRTIFTIGWDSVFIFTFYLATIYIIYIT